MAYQARLVRWLSEQKLAGNRISLRDIAKRSKEVDPAGKGVSWSVVQRLHGGKQKRFAVETLELVGLAIGEGPDFFFRSEDATDPPVGRSTRNCPFRDKETAREAVAGLYRQVGPDHCQSFTLICACRETGKQRILVVKNGAIDYVGPDRHGKGTP